MAAYYWLRDGSEAGWTGRADPVTSVYDSGRAPAHDWPCERSANRSLGARGSPAPDYFELIRELDVDELGPAAAAFMQVSRARWPTRARYRGYTVSVFLRTGRFVIDVGAWKDARAPDLNQAVALARMTLRRLG